MKPKIQILEKAIDRIDVTCIGDRSSKFIDGDVKVRFSLKNIFDCTVQLQWKDEYESDEKLAKVILSKIYNEL